MNVRAMSLFRRENGRPRCARARARGRDLRACVGKPSPRAQDDLPGRVGRVADVAGELFLAPQDQPDAVDGRSASTTR